MAERGRGPSEIVKRSVVIAGHATSVSLEAAFWSALKAAAERRGVSASQLVALIDSERSSGNLSSAIRVFVFTDSLRHVETVEAAPAP